MDLESLHYHWEEQLLLERFLFGFENPVLQLMLQGEQEHLLHEWKLVARIPSDPRSLTLTPGKRQGTPAVSAGNITTTCCAETPPPVQGCSALHRWCLCCCRMLNQPLQTLLLCFIIWLLLPYRHTYFLQHLRCSSGSAIITNYHFKL